MSVEGDPIPSAPGHTQTAAAAPTVIPAPGPGDGEPGEAEAQFYSEEDFQRQLLGERQGLPALVLALSGMGTVVIYATRGLAAQGFAGAAIMAMLSGALLCLAIVLGLAAGWVVCRMFSEEDASLRSLVLRFGAIAAAQFPTYAGLALVLDDLPAFFASVLPAIALCILVARLSLAQTVVFVATLDVLMWWMLAVLGMAETGQAAL
jgi:hypothetical protein